MESKMTVEVLSWWYLQGWNHFGEIRHC